MASKYDNAPTLLLNQKEVVTLSLYIVYSQGSAQDLSSATDLQLTVKSLKTNSTYDITIAFSSFDLTNAATGTITCPLTATNTDLQGEYWALLKITFSATNIKKGYFKIFFDPSEE